MKTIGMKIKGFREAARMTQDELARKVGYTNRSAISRVERGDYDLPQSKIVAFANALNIPVSALMDYDEAVGQSEIKESYTVEAVKLYEKYSMLTANNQNAVRTMIDALLASQERRS